MIKADQETDFEWSGRKSWLVCCPVCGFEFSHHGEVEIFDREKGEDGDTIIKKPGSKEKTPSTLNPSPRRNAIRIHFDGECGHKWYLDLVQHKGNTFIFTEPTG